MTQEEKTRAYDELLDKAKQIYNKENDILIKHIIEGLFPELKESEDEKIRKAIINLVDTEFSDRFPFDGFTREQMIAWLEKQGEQNSSDKVEPKFHEGDWVFIEEVKGYKNGPFQIKTVDSFGYSFDEYHTIPFMYENLLSKWTIQEAKDGDILFQDLMGGKTFIYNGVNPDMAILYSFIISNNGEDVLPYHIGKPNTGIGYIEENKNIIHPATKEQRELLFQKMKEAGYEWDAEKKELKKVEQKPAWSEEDEKIKRSLVYLIEEIIRQPLKRSEDWKGYVAWLKSFKDRVLPQPKQEWSEEDEDILNTIINHFEIDLECTKNDDIIRWLKSLRPQNH